jgi:hypothetical protein
MDDEAWICDRIRRRVLYSIKTLCFDYLPISQNREGVNYVLATLRNTEHVIITVSPHCPATRSTVAGFLEQTSHAQEGVLHPRTIRRLEYWYEIIFPDHKGRRTVWSAPVPITVLSAHRSETKRHAWRSHASIWGQSMNFRWAEW